jgi:2-phosphoglycerate kinase
LPAPGAGVLTDRRYRQPLPLGGEDGLPFSKGLMARALIAAGISADRAYELALAVEAELTASARPATTIERLEEVALETLGPEDGAAAMRRLRRYRDLYELDLPIILLVGGATGTGKSTVATDVAYRLGITRVTSTDFVRQTMRAFFSRDFMPAIHHSSFEAGRAMADEDRADADAVLDGFLQQTREVLVGVRAAIDRALEEGWSCVIEGVHLVPGMLPKIDGALVVECVLSIADAEAHASHFWIRDSDSDGVRPYEKYLESFDDIRLIQTYILGRARKNDVPVIENGNIEDAIGEVMELVLTAAELAPVGP